MHRQSNVHIKTQGLRAKKEDDRIYNVTVRQCTEYYDGGYINGWAHLVLSVILPIFVSVMINASGDIGDIGGMPEISVSEVTRYMEEIRDKDDVADMRNEMKIFIDSLNVTASSGTYRSMVYYVCVTSAIVLMALEFSHVHMLRESARSWVPAIQTCLVLDIMILIVLGLVVLHPNSWSTQGGFPSSTTIILMLITTFTSLYVTTVTLHYARVAGALHDRKIDISKIGAARIDPSWFKRQG